MIIRSKENIVLSGHAGNSPKICTSKQGRKFISLQVCANDNWFSVSLKGNNVDDLCIKKGDAVFVAGTFKRNGDFNNVIADVIVKQSNVSCITSSNKSSHIDDEFEEIIEAEDLSF